MACLQSKFTAQIRPTISALFTNNHVLEHAMTFITYIFACYEMYPPLLNLHGCLGTWSRSHASRMDRKLCQCAEDVQFLI